MNFEEIGTLIKTEYAEKSSALSVIEAQIDAELQAEEEQRQAEFDKHKAQLEGEDVFLKEIGTQITQGMDTAELEAVRRQLHE
jgi:maltodextrin utilization protein YvdJ